jgi:hypothetical protein
MKPVEFRSKATFKILLLGLIAAVPSAYLMGEGGYHVLGNLEEFQTGLLYYLVGTPCLLMALLFLAQAFTPKKVLWDSSLLEIHVGRVEHKIRWEKIQDIFLSHRFLIAEIGIETDSHTFWISQLDFPNILFMYKLLQEAFAEKQAQLKKEEA